MIVKQDRVNGSYDVIDMLIAIRSYLLRYVNNGKAWIYELKRGNVFALAIEFDDEIANTINSLSSFDALSFDIKRLYNLRNNVPKPYVVIFGDDERYLYDVIKEFYENVTGKVPTFMYKNELAYKMNVSPNVGVL